MFGKVSDRSRPGSVQRPSPNRVGKPTRSAWSLTAAGRARSEDPRPTVSRVEQVAAYRRKNDLKGQTEPVQAATSAVAVLARLPSSPASGINTTRPTTAMTIK